MGRRLAPLKAPQTAAVIADQLRERILDGSFDPGEQLSEANLAAQLQLSRGPVREALQRLVQEGLLVSHRNRGVFVVELTATDVAEIYAAREAVETAAAVAVFTGNEELRTMAVKKLTAIVATMPRLVEAHDWRKLAKQDVAFHTTLVKAGGNSRLVRMYATLAAESRICMVHLENAYFHPQSLVEEHQHIVDLLAAGPRRSLEAAIRQHMVSAVSDLSLLMSRHAETKQEPTGA
jgi:DNA-binding GntR family transcriptional regulator